MTETSNGDRRQLDQFTRRSLLLGGVQAAGLGLVGWRLFDLQVMGAHRYGPLAENNRLNLQVVAPKRGRILDRSGRVLADNEQVFRVTITPAIAKNVGGVLRRVSRILPLTDDEIAKIVARARKQGRNVPTTVASDLSFEQVAHLNLAAPSLPGINTEFALRRRYLGGSALCHVVGFVGSVERFTIDDDAVARLPEMRIGKSGAELGFDGDLRGAGGTQKVEVDARGRVVRNLETVDPVAGRDVTLTIDSELQRLVGDRLQSGASAAAAVLVDIQTGGIVVMASAPGFDPGAIAGGITAADWQKLAQSEDKPLLNRAVAGQYAPGSTFVVVTALAALEAGVLSPGERIVCHGEYEYRGDVYRCSKREGHGSLSLHEAISSSCEVFFCEVAARLGIARLSAAARALGLGATWNFGLSEEKSGLVPDPDWKRGNLNSAWLGGETLLTGIGQGYVQATPLQLAVMTARIASGRSVVPQLEKRDGISGFVPLGFSEAHVDAVRQGMAAAVNEQGGSAEEAKLGAGRPVVAGKTGASKMFIGYEPAETPRYAIATVVERGNASAALLARDILNFAVDRADHAGGKSPQGGGVSPTGDDTGKAG
ncbi:penicillin-binding protein 2 [Hyphomicrobium facile]|uniref:Peptidoglycan glycosyltransferase n=1 Tax=Hyphomicrobium facile TaxID=51670 RepID=A0A1I7N406_9HYPH|nr:penicillin-binding protein 2 [Hyphomicrobium facile]SFV29388.1 peptidoglycan glycosyltransferase [Hyphomicrobium facile]